MQLSKFVLRVSRRFVLSVTCAGLVFVLATTAFAQKPGAPSPNGDFNIPGQKFMSSMAPLQEVPTPTGSPTGFGVGVVVLDPAETQIAVVMFYTGLTSNAILGHIHGPGAPGSTAPIMFDLVPSGGTTGGNTVSTFATTPAQVASLRQGLLYFNVHTSTNPSGEIRGQIHLQDMASNFDADGSTDAAVFRPSDGTWYALESFGGAATYQPFGVATDVIVPGDYNGDGGTDFAVWRPSTGIWYVLPSANDSFFAVQFGASTDIPVPADYDKDGKTDIAVFRPSEGNWYVLPSSTGTFTGLHWGQSGDRPMPADYDADGKADFAVYRPTGGNWYALKSSDGAPIIKQFGLNTDQAAAADYDGDGKADFAVYRATGGASGPNFWYVFKSSTSTLDGWNFGAAGDLIAVGDFDSDAKADSVVFRPSTGRFLIRKSFESTPTVSALQVIVWGTSGDLPLSSIYVR